MSPKDKELAASWFLIGYCTDRSGEADADLIDRIKGEFEKVWSHLHKVSQ